jgi:hypothetical protein
VVTIYIPEYVVGHWWEQLLHNQSALWLIGRLLFTPGVMVTNVPDQLASSHAAAARADHAEANAPNLWIDSVRGPKPERRDPTQP